MSTIKITKVKSGIDRNLRTKNTLKALGLGKMGTSITFDSSNLALAGMVAKVKHLLKIETV